jgi:hypothetical protein
VASKYAHIDPKHLVPRAALETALDFYDKNQTTIQNKNWITVIDFNKYSGQRRFFVVDMKSGEAYDFHTAHGSGSDPSNTGYAEKFSNIEGSKMSSVGFYLTGSIYDGSHGASLYLDGLSSSNSRARSRAIVIHSANYVDASFSRMGRSWGCPALDGDVKDWVINRIKGKSLVYAFHD